MNINSAVGWRVLEYDASFIYCESTRCVVTKQLVPVVYRAVSVRSRVVRLTLLS